MWKTLLPSLDSLAIRLLAFVFIFASGLFMGHHLTAKLYDAKEQKAALAVEVKRDAIERKGDALVVKYVNKTKKLTDNLQAVQQQIPEVFAKEETKADETTTTRNCTVPRGFVRLFNDSATGGASAPDDTDADTTDVDLATILETLTANNARFNEVREQLIELQEFERQATKK